MKLKGIYNLKDVLKIFKKGIYNLKNILKYITNYELQFNFAPLTVKDNLCLFVCEAGTLKDVLDLNSCV